MDMEKFDQIMALIQEMGEAAAAHAVAVHEFSMDRAEYAPIKRLAIQWSEAKRAVVEALLQEVR